MKTSSLERFVELSREGTFVPVWKEIAADLLTPVSAFLKIAEHTEHAFLFESVEGGESVGRYSFLGKDPFLVLRAREGQTLLERAGETTALDIPFLEALRSVLAEHRAPLVPELPRFTGGGVGYLSYDTAAWSERVPLQAVDPTLADDLRDEAGIMIFDTVLAFDHVQHRILIIANARVRPDSDLEALYQFARARIEFLERELDRELSGHPPVTQRPLEVRSNVSHERFLEMVRTAKEYIAAGDVYQVVLSQRFEAEVEADPFTVYRALRRVNPSPYMFFLRLGTLSIVGASPEMLVRVEGQRAQTHPIAGTRPRGGSEAEDQQLEVDLAADEKERAEHVMLVDLGRNDIGRVAEYGSVKVPKFMAVERYSHVMHLVSVVDGRLAPNRDRLDALTACFPAGTVSGAPKVRAMEIIAEQEPDRRGIYAGAVGYVDFSGNLDFCIAIRTVVMTGRTARVQAGAGIVADSDPETEFRETQHKAQALLRALELAEEGL